jgi:hypothetical protein
MDKETRKQEKILKQIDRYERRAATRDAYHALRNKRRIVKANRREK